jgi:tRNA pseudouridine65 synthase
MSAEQPLTILFQDEYLVAIDKPAGLLVHPSRIAREQTRSAMMLLRDQLGRWVYPLHRLDRPTSGVMLFALSPEVARQMGEQFSAQRVQKRYLAVVRGYTDADGLIDHPLQEKLDRITDARARSDKPPQPASSAYITLGQVELPWPSPPFASSRYSLLEARPLTGRKHQLRRHFKHISHPIIGDTSYGKSAHNRLFRDYLGSTRLLLAAVALSFEHPDSGDCCQLAAPLSGEFINVVNHLWPACDYAQ